MTKKDQLVEMEDPLWGLLDRYVVVLNRELKRRKLPRVAQGDIIGAIVTRYLLAHRVDILEAHAQVHLERTLGAAGAFLRSSGLHLAQATLTATTAPAPSAEDTRGAGQHRSTRRRAAA